MTQADSRTTHHQSPPTRDASASTETLNQPLWPIQVARDIHKRVDGHIGMTLTIWATSTIGLGLCFVLCTSYIWPLWRRSWLSIWPSSLPESVIALPLLALILGTLLNRLWHGRIWAGLILTTYVVLHANLYVPSPTAEEAGPQVAIQAAEQAGPQAVEHLDTQVASVPTALRFRQLGPLITKQPEIVFLGIATAIVPVMAIWLFGVVSLSFLWPSIVACILMFNTYRQARDEQRRINAQRTLQQERMQRQLEHEQQMNNLRFQAWSDEEQHVALENSIARQHQQRELLTYQQNVLALSQRGPQAAPAQSTDELVAQLVNQQ